MCFYIILYPFYIRMYFISFQACKNISKQKVKTSNEILWAKRKI
eukprot:UN27243